MIRIPALLLAIIAMLIAAPATAYWEYGHQQVAGIAIRNVRPETRAQIDALLRRHALLETPTCPARTIEQASVWADCIKALGPRYSHASSWHYQNVNVCRPFDLKAACKDGNCVSAQIERMTKLLADTSLPARVRIEALAFLVHFVGDLHQPLHAGDKGDLGGNQVRAAYGAHAPDRLNLHSVWDGYLAERAFSQPPSLLRSYGADERAAMQAGTVEDWSRESWQLSRDVTYATALGGDPCTEAAKPNRRAELSQATIAAIAPRLRDLGLRGGLRLARLLDEALAKPSAKARAKAH